MSSTIGEPFQLFLGSTHSQTAKACEIISCTYSCDFPGHVTVTGQADGIHVWDLQNLHAVASYSVDHGTFFATPAFTLRVTENGNKSLVSYMLIRSAPGLAPEFRGRIIYVIRQRLSGSTVAAIEKTKVVVEDPPVQICGTGNDTLPLLFVSEKASLSLASAQVSIKSQLDWPGKRRHLETFVFSRGSCGFIQDATDSWYSAAVTCSQSGTSLHVRLVLLGEVIIPAGTCEIPIASSAKRIVTSGLTCSSSGILSFVDTRGTWATYQLASINSSLVSNLVSENLHLMRFNLCSKHPGEGGCFSIVSLGTSLVLLAAVVEGTEAISLQIWDLAYGVLLSTQSMPKPSSLTSYLRLTVADEGQVLLTVLVRDRGSTPKRSSIYVVPVDARLKSSLAAALGKMALTAEWLAPEALKRGSGDGSGKILFEVRSLLTQGLPQKAEQAFLKWVNSHSARDAILGHEFVKKVFNIVLPPEAPTNYPYTSRITRCLLENAVVSTIMLNGRLITRLRERGDWENLMYALTTVTDIGEDELMSSAKCLIDQQRRNENAMDVDRSEGYVPPLWSYLMACVSYPFSAAPMRVAIRKHLPDAQDLVLILEILESWIQGGTEHEIEVLLKSFARDTTMPSSMADSPPYSKIIAFLQALLDASFVALLQYQPSHDLLRRTLSYIVPEISLIDSLEPLRGMLEPFVRAQSLRENTGMSKETPAEWRKRKKQIEQRDSLGVGLYRLEELTF